MSLDIYKPVWSTQLSPWWWPTSTQTISYLFIIMYQVVSHKIKITMCNGCILKLVPPPFLNGSNGNSNQRYKRTSLNHCSTYMTTCQLVPVHALVYASQKVRTLSSLPLGNNSIYGASGWLPKAWRLSHHYDRVVCPERRCWNNHYQFQQSFLVHSQETDMTGSSILASTESLRKEFHTHYNLLQTHCIHEVHDRREEGGGAGFVCRTHSNFNIKWVVHVHWCTKWKVVATRYTYLPRTVTHLP